MKSENKKSLEKLQEINIDILQPLIKGLKIAKIENFDISDELSGVVIGFSNKDGDRFYLVFKPESEDDGKLKISTSVYHP